jgi:hypothetical protein
VAGRLGILGQPGPLSETLSLTTTIIFERKIVTA